MSAIRGTGSNEITQTVSQPVSTNQSAVISTNDQAALQAQIAALTAQIAALQGSVATLTEHHQEEHEHQFLDNPEPQRPTTQPTNPIQTLPVGGPITTPGFPSPGPITTPGVPRPQPTPSELRTFVREARRESLQDLRENRRELRALRRDGIPDEQQRAEFARVRGEINASQSQAQFWREQSQLDFTKVANPAGLMAGYQALDQISSTDDNSGLAQAQRARIKGEIVLATYRNPLSNSPSSLSRPIDPREELAFSEFKTEFYQAQGQSLLDLRNAYRGINTPEAHAQRERIDAEILGNNQAKTFWKAEDRFWTDVNTRLSNGRQNLHGESKNKLEASLSRHTEMENLFDQLIGIETEDPTVLAQRQTLRVDIAKNKAVAKSWIGAAQFDARYGQTNANGEIQAREDTFSSQNRTQATNLLRELAALNNNRESAILQHGWDSNQVRTVNDSIAAKRVAIAGLANT